MKRALIIFTLFFTLALLLGRAPVVFACTCYDDTTSKDVSGTDACIALCGEDDATEKSNGVCNCSTSIRSLDCSSVCSEAGLSATSSAAAATGDSEKAAYISPTLQVKIPGVKFSEVLKEGGNLKINWLGEYVSGVYVFLIGIGTMIAIVMIMIGGLQYSLAAGGSDTSNAKKRIRDAITGITLLLSVYMILAIVNPNLVFFSAIELIEINQIKLDLATSGNEGGGGTISRRTCDKIVEEAKDDGDCSAKQLVASPTGSQPSCGNHHWFSEAKGEWENLRSLDWAAGWGSDLLAPFDGKLSYRKSTNTSNRCGNVIALTGTGDAAGLKVSICHAKDFVDNSGTMATETTQGTVIGHLGGNCCSGENPPSAWASAKNGWCNVSGTPCKNPETGESCDCQPVEQAGNTSGPHVHMTWYGAGSFLQCLDY